MGRLLRFRGVAYGGVVLALMFVASSCSDEQSGQTSEEARPAPEEVTREVTKVVTVAEVPKQDRPNAPNPEREPERRPAAAPPPEPQSEPVDDVPSDEQYEPGSPSEPATDSSAPEAEGGTTATLVVGETATTDDGNGITVHSYEYVPPTDVWQSEPGFEYNAADVEACAGSETAEPNPFDFVLQMPDNTRLTPDVGVREPPLDATTLPPGDCVRGYVTFQVPEGETPAYLVYEVFGSSIIKWAVQEVVRAEQEGAQYEPESTSEAEAPLPEATSDESPSPTPSEEEYSTEPTSEPTPQYETTSTTSGEPSEGEEVPEGTTAQEQY